MDKILFSERFVKRRTAKGYSTQVELATAYNEKFQPVRSDKKSENKKSTSGILGTIKHLENPNYEGSPRLDIVENFCELLECDIDYLTGRIDTVTNDIEFISEKTLLSPESVEILTSKKQTWMAELSHHPEQLFNDSIEEYKEMKDGFYKSGYSTAHRISEKEILSLLLQNESFWHILGDIKKLQIAKSKEQTALQEYHFSQNKYRKDELLDCMGDELNEMSNILQQCKDKSDITRFNISRMFSNLIESIT